MMLIPCPYCGPRDVTEFTYGGDAGVRRPDGADAAADADRVYLRDNPRGSHDEVWQHSAGCRRWIAVRRDTYTHDVIAAALPGALPAEDFGNG